MRKSIRLSRRAWLFSTILLMIEFRHLEELMKRVLGISYAVVAYVAGFAVTPNVTRAQEQRLPIIDMHLHTKHSGTRVSLDWGATTLSEPSQVVRLKSSSNGRQRSLNVSSLRWYSHSLEACPTSPDFVPPINHPDSKEWESSPCSTRVLR